MSVPATSLGILEDLPQPVPSFRLLQKLGEGGMGEVFEAGCTPRSEISMRQHPIHCSCFLSFLAGLLFLGCGGPEAVQEGEPAALEEERAAVIEELRAEEEAVENLVFRPMDLPPADYSNAPTETEPNDEEEEATPLGPDLMVQGTFEGREYDYYTFATEGEPQLYAVEATGEHLADVEYSDLSGDRELLRSAVEGQATLTNLYLPPGRHLLSVRGETGPYTLRVIPLGPPDPYAEMEPNDEESRAHLLRFGRSRLGYLTEAADNDYYRFTLRSPEHLLLSIVPPIDLAVRAHLFGGEGHMITLQGGEAGDSISYEAHLPMGQYHIRISSGDNHSAGRPMSCHIFRSR